MDAPSTSPERHERGIHALRPGAGGARVTKVVIVVVRRSLARRQVVTDFHSGRLAGKFVPFAGLTCWIRWLIRAMRLIGGTPVHQINHEARIHHAKRTGSLIDVPRRGLAMVVVLGEDEVTPDSWPSHLKIGCGGGEPAAPQPQRPRSRRGPRSAPRPAIGAATPQPARPAIGLATLRSARPAAQRSEPSSLMSRFLARPPR
jgi:hypothetical protein